MPSRTPKEPYPNGENPPSPFPPETVRAKATLRTSPAQKPLQTRSPIRTYSKDNFPLVGDYDFNDVVLDVKTRYHREKKDEPHQAHTAWDVTLAAAGSKQSR